MQMIIYQDSSFVSGWEFQGLLSGSISYHCVALENATVEDGAMIYPDTILH